MVLEASQSIHAGKLELLSRVAHLQDCSRTVPKKRGGRGKCKKKKKVKAKDRMWRNRLAPNQDFPRSLNFEAWHKAHTLSLGPPATQCLYLTPAPSVQSDPTPAKIKNRRPGCPSPGFVLLFCGAGKQETKAHRCPFRGNRWPWWMIKPPGKPGPSMFYQNNQKGHLCQGVAE